jgi:BirA family biotin operon repressor/biotin-[acetyl-CoA-carboxylase] ligase
MFERMTETRAGLQTRRLARTARYLAQVDSTQAEARRLLMAGVPDGTVVVAGEQTAGRGRLGRAWHSPPGNLYASLVLRPSLPLAEWPQCTMAAALAIAGTLDALPVPGVALKWPNDVLIDGRKVAGMLAEAMDASLIVGFGVNANAELPA